MNEPSLKRLAWRYGCAPTGSLEEKRARQVLIERILRDERPSKVHDRQCRAAGRPKDYCFGCHDPHGCVCHERPARKSARQAARDRDPLDGADAQALEGWGEDALERWSGR